MQLNMSCSVFELSNAKEPLRHQKNYEDIDADNRTWLSGMHSLAVKEDISLKYTVHPFPHLRLKEPEKLREKTFDADIAVCMYPDLSFVGPELAHLIVDRKQEYRHVFIVTQRYLPDSQQELQAAVSTIPRASVQMESLILESIPLGFREGEEVYDAEESRVISYWNVREIRKEDPRRQIQTILSIL